MLARLQTKNTYSLLVEMQIGTATLEINIENIKQTNKKLKKPKEIKINLSYEPVKHQTPQIHAWPYSLPSY